MLASPDTRSSRPTRQPEPAAEVSKEEVFDFHYRNLFSATVAQFLLAIVSTFLFAFANLSFFAPGEVTQHRLSYSLVAFFGSLMAMLSSTIIICCSARDPADSGQLISFIMLNTCSVVVLVVGAVMMSTSESADQPKGLLGWSIALSLMTAVEATVAIFLAYKSVTLRLELERDAPADCDHDAGML
jgi:hypothetical protein